MTVALAELPCVIRPAVADDRAFVWETLGKVRQPLVVGWKDWVRLHGAEYDDLLDTSSPLVVDGGGVILAFLVVRDGVVEMLYVKRDFRGFGLGLGLLRAESSLKWSPVLQARHPTRSWRRWTESQGIPWVEAP